MKPTAVAPPRRNPASVTVLLAALAGGVASFALGRLAAPSPAPVAAFPRGASPPSRDDRPPAFPLAPPPGAAAAPAAPAVPAPPPAAPPAERSTVIVRATDQARSGLETLRRELVARCWPQEGLGRGREQARLTFRVTFDASGREIARAISEDRAAPAGPFGRCLRSLPIGSLGIEPPGRTVSVTVPFTFP